MLPPQGEVGTCTVSDKRRVSKIVLNEAAPPKATCLKSSKPDLRYWSFFAF